MATKGTFYLFGFISGTVTGILLGVLSFLSRNKKKPDLKKVKVKKDQKKKKK